jgi:signal transduction histidine kinase
MSGVSDNRTSNHLPVLYRLGKLVTASLDLDATLGAIVDAAHELTGADSTAILLQDEDGSLVIRIGRGIIAASVGERVSVQSSLAGRALRTGGAVLVDDMVSEADRARPDIDQRSGTRSYLASPLIWRDEHVGVVTVGGGRPSMFGEDQVQLVTELAEQAAVAVAHARAYSEERRLRQEGEVLVRQLSERTTELERLQQQLVQTEKLTAIGQLAQGLAHEINTPLSIVITNLSVLGRTTESLAAIARAAEQTLPLLIADPLSAAVAAPLDAAVRRADLAYSLQDMQDMLSESTTASRRVTELVRSMSEFARRDTGGPKAVSVQDVLEAALNLASNPLNQHAQIVREYGDTPHVLGLTSELTELFVHLLMNAAQALEEQPGTVTVSTSQEPDGVVIRISDTGCGIPAEHLPSVFDPFFTTRPPGGGSGMGLAVCHGIVARHSGSIALDSQPGQGTLVTIRLPRTESQRVAA